MSRAWTSKLETNSVPSATTGVPQTSLDIRNRQGRQRVALAGGGTAARRTQSVSAGAAPGPACSARGPGPIRTEAPDSRTSTAPAPAAGAPWRRAAIFSVAASPSRAESCGAAVRPCCGPWPCRPVRGSPGDDNWGAGGWAGGGGPGGAGCAGTTGGWAAGWRRLRLRSIRSSAFGGNQSPASPEASSRENRCGASSAWIWAGVGRCSGAGRMQARTRSTSSTGRPERSGCSRSSWKTVSTGLAPR